MTDRHLNGAENNAITPEVENSKVRFAPLIRVSTESQEKRGYSLQVQTDALEKAIKSLGGVIPEDCWEYSGQEHATSNFERVKFSKLLQDCDLDKFDAIIVYDPSRWSRNNLKSKEGLEVLKKNGIRFFVGTTEYNLFDPQATLFLGMSTEMNEYFALEQSRKSILSRIERAKTGKPTAGKLPFGRTFDKRTGTWGIDEDKKRNIVWAADQYLAGASMTKIAKTLGMNHSNLWKVLNHRSGPEWKSKFQDKRLQIDETVEIEIPPLLQQDTIDAIHRKSDLNKKFDRRNLKRNYLLSKVIYCGECGLSMFGQANKNERWYYRHSRNGDGTCSHKSWSIPATIIEEAVLYQMYGLMGDKQKVEQAVTKAVPNLSKRIKIEKDNETLAKNLKAVKVKRVNLVNAVADGLFIAEDIKDKMYDLREQEGTLLKEIETNKNKIKRIPSEKELKQRTEFAQKILNFAKSRYLQSVEHLCEMSFEAKRDLIVSVFLGTDDTGRQDGVYVKKVDNTWHYEIQGSILSNIATNLAPKVTKENNDAQLANVERLPERKEILHGSLPLTEDDIIELLDLDADLFEDQLNLLSKRHAHNGVCVYQ